MTSMNFNKELLARAPELRTFISLHLPAELERVLTPEDVMQEVWMRAHKFVKEFGEESVEYLDAWLKSIATNVMADLFRGHLAVKRGGKHQRLSTDRESKSLLDLFNLVLSPRATPSSDVAIGEAINAVQAAMTALPTDQAEVVRLYYLEGRSYDEVSKETNRSVSAVRGLLTRARMTMRGELRSAARFFSDAATPQPPSVAERDT